MDKHWLARANITITETVIGAKRNDLIAYNRDPNENNMNVLRVARNNAKQSARLSANDYWLQLDQSIQMSSNVGNSRSRSIHKDHCSNENKDKRDHHWQQMDTWVEYLELYSSESTASKKATYSTENLPIVEELDIEHTLEVLNKTIDPLANWKSPEDDVYHLKLFCMENVHCYNTWLMNFFAAVGKRAQREGHNKLQRGYIQTFWHRKGVKQGCVWLQPTLAYSRRWR